AKAEGAMALFGEKYAEDVRTISIGEGENRYSYELCGGNHVPDTAVIGTFHITQETSVAQGVRRVEAVTGRAANQFTAVRLNILHTISKNLGVVPEDAPSRIAALQGQLKALQHERDHMLRQMARITFENLSTRNIDGVQVLIARVGNANMDTLREMTDWFRDRNPQGGVAVLGAVGDDDKPLLVATVTKDLTDKLHAGNIIKDIAALVGGGGGGRPNMAQAGGKDSAKLDDALQRAAEIIGAALEG
ncbi:MAG: DHHA1 domain-containing protein, partial [Anaerolineales bacterium]